MADYTKTVDFAAKDALLTGNPAKLVKGTEIDTEFNNIATSIASKIEESDAIGTPTSGTLTNCTGLPVSTGISGLGTGVATALAVNVGSAGAPVVNAGALGTPSSGTLTNCTSLPISTGVSGLGTGVASFLATPSSANLATALTDEIGTGLAIFGTTGTVTPALRDAAAGTAATVGAAVGEYQITGGRCSGTLHLINIDVTALTGTNQIFITGLPATSKVQANSLYPVAIRWNGVDSTAGTITGYVNQGSTYIQLENPSTTATAALLVNSITAGTEDINISFDYPI